MVLSVTDNLLKQISNKSNFKLDDDDDDDDDCFKVAQASRHSGYPLLPNSDS